VWGPAGDQWEDLGMRLFVGLDLPAEIIGHLAGLIEGLRQGARISWSTAANLHITTKFIGWWPDGWKR
jgi:RNA 2',3'-cyclic 3'-phosphodiesterase